MAGLVLNPYTQFKDDAGLILSNGTLTFSVNKGTGATTIFTTLEADVQQSNPYPLDAAGRLTGDVYYTGLRRMVVKRSSGATIRTLDDVAVLQSVTQGYDYIAKAQGATFTAVTGENYIVDRGGTITLPASATQGDIIRFQVVDLLSGSFFTFKSQGQDAIRIGDLDNSGLADGEHDGANDAAVMTDSGESWTVNQWVGFRISNTTDGSTAPITANTATTVTGTLTGGTDNDWDTNDIYTIELDTYTTAGTLRFSFIEAVYTAPTTGRFSSYWGLRLSGSDGRALILNPNNETFEYLEIPGDENVGSYLVALDAQLQDQVNPIAGYLTVTGTTNNIRNTSRYKNTLFTGSSASTFTVTSNEGVFRHLVFNNGTADITIEAGAGVTDMTLLNGERTTGTADITMPPGTWCEVRKLDAANALIWTPFVTVGRTPVTEYTIASGVITIADARSPALITIDTEADAASDTLDTITGGYEGQVLICQSADNARDVIFSDTTGNLQIGSNFTSLTTSDKLSLIKNGSNWDQISRSTN